MKILSLLRKQGKLMDIMLMKDNMKTNKKLLVAAKRYVFESINIISELQFQFSRTLFIFQT